MRKMLAAAAALSFLIASPAFAIDYTQVILDEQGCPMHDDPNLTTIRTTATIADPVKCPRAEKMMPPDLTLGLIAYHAMMWVAPDETPGYPGSTPINGEQKQERGDLGKRVRNAKDDATTPEELTIIRKQVGKLYGPMIVSEVFPLLNPTAKKKAPPATPKPID